MRLKEPSFIEHEFGDKITIRLSTIVLAFEEEMTDCKEEEDDDIIFNPDESITLLRKRTLKKALKEYKKILKDIAYNVKILENELQKRKHCKS